MSLDELVSAVLAWVNFVRPDAEVALRPLADPNTDGMSLRVLGLRSLNDGRNTLARRDPVIDLLEVELLMSVGGSDPKAAAVAATDLYFAALEGAPPFTVDAAANALDIGRRLGLQPAIGIVLRGRIARERTAKPIPLVREARFELVERAALKGERPAPVSPPSSEPASTSPPSRRPARRADR